MVTDAVLNYFNYFTEIEERFRQRRGSLMLLSTLDWALIEIWQDAGIPLDAAFDKFEGRQKKGRQRKVNGLAWCAQSVMEAAEELREAAAGTAAPKSDASAPESGFEHGRIAMHLEAAATALDRATVAGEACIATAVRLRHLAAAVRGDAGLSPEDVAAVKNLEDLERHLTVLEGKLFAALTAAAPEALVVRLQEHADRELAPYRRQMAAVQIRQVKQQFEQKQL